MEKVQIKENVEWLRNCPTNNVNDLSTHRMLSWLKIGQRKKTLTSETYFCDPQVLEGILKSKTELNNIDRKKLMHARSMCNPFEEIGRSIFQNRAAVKMANLDVILNYMFTNREPLHKDLLYFADVCAGPGGFSQYILWRTKGRAKGFGFTLRGKNDFTLAIKSGTFDCYYGIKDDGNVFDPENILSLKKYINNVTQGVLVDFMMADGGFSVYDENIQEILSKQLYLCQCLVGLSIVRDGGDIVIKFFDCFTKFTVGLIYLMYKSFTEICIVKPRSSRPANSERYLVCKNKKANQTTIEEYLLQISRNMWSGASTDADVIELVPYEILTGDRDFFDYMCNTNNRIARSQINSLKEILSFIGNRNIVTWDKRLISSRCLHEWGLPSHQTHQKNVSTQIWKFQCSGLARTK